MKDALLNYADCNVIIVDWSKSNRIPFALAVANTRVVGAEIALLINFLEVSIPFFLNFHAAEFIHL